MPIEFACPSCQLHYRVKDELAGKGAKCKCGHHIKIPQATPAKAAASTVAAPKPAKPSRATAPPAAVKNSAAGSWLDEELETSQPAIPTKRGATCPSCGAVLGDGAVLCVSCGHDTRTNAKLQTVKELEPAKASKGKGAKLGSAASLIRGTLFSFIAAVLGAIVWAVLAYMTEREFGMVAWALGGLVGFGMALGHEDDDGTTAGIIAAFMSLFGIIAAKVLIIVIVVGAAVASVVGNLEVDGDAAPLEVQREFLALAVAEDKLEQKGLNSDDASEQQWEEALAEAKKELEGLDEAGLEKKVAELEANAERRELAEEDADDEAPAGGQAADNAEVAAEDEPGMVGLFFSEMFSPIDGLFILLAFFTAYKVGSGQATD